MATKPPRTSKTEAVDCPFVETPPETWFRIRCIASETAGKRPQPLRRGATPPPSSSAIVAKLLVRHLEGLRCGEETAGEERRGDGGVFCSRPGDLETTRIVGRPLPEADNHLRAVPPAQPLT